jgi:hypothetical protein
MPESQGSTPSERIKSDHEATSRLLDSLEVECAPSAVYRMGRYPNPVQKGPRLVKIVFPATKFQRISLAQWKRKRDIIQAQEGHRRLIIRPSMTPEELAVDRGKRQMRWAAMNNANYQQNNPNYQQQTGSTNNTTATDHTYAMEHSQQPQASQPQENN